jgi:hypothetical protein
MSDDPKVENLILRRLDEIQKTMRAENNAFRAELNARHADVMTAIGNLKSETEEHFRSLEGSLRHISRIAEELDERVKALEKDTA